MKCLNSEDFQVKQQKYHAYRIFGFWYRSYASISNPSGGSESATEYIFFYIVYNNKKSMKVY